MEIGLCGEYLKEAKIGCMGFEKLQFDFDF